MSYTLTDGLTRQQIIDRLVADDIRLMHKASIDDLVAEWKEIKDDYDYFDQVYEVN